MEKALKSAFFFNKQLQNRGIFDTISIVSKEIMGD
jgi:hypothetical protein